MKGAVYGISKDEVANVEGWASSAREADAVVLVDTGSSDATVKRAKKRGVDVSKLKLDEFRFDLWQTAKIMRESELAERYPRNPLACSRYGRMCDYWDVCCGVASLDDPTRFKKREPKPDEPPAAAA